MPKKYIPWKQVMSQLRAGHPLPEIAKWTVGAHPHTLRRRSKTDLEPAIYEEFRRLVWKNKRPSGGKYGVPGQRAQCGTPAGAQRHYRRGEEACLPCKLAKSEHYIKYYEKKRKKKNATEEDDR